MRFAFYGRVSTEDQQDPQASKAWQLSRARSLIEPTGGEIVAEFFDIGQSRSLPWKRRPESLRLLDTIKSPARDFDAATVLGERVGVPEEELEIARVGLASATEFQGGSTRERTEGAVRGRRRADGAQDAAATDDSDGAESADEA